MHFKITPMDIEKVREYCISFEGISESFPFDDDSLVFKVENKMFALLNLSATQNKIALKCDPDLAIKLKDKFEGIVGAWHFNKKYWIDVFFDSDVSDDSVKKLIEHSYHQVICKLTKKIQGDYHLNFTNIPEIDVFH